MNKEALPKFNETFMPILEILSDGKEIKHRALLNQVVEKNYKHLPKELLELTTKSGDSLIFSRISWGKSYLKKGGFISYPSRGYAKITEKGKNSLSKNLSLDDVVNDTDFLEFYSDEKPKNDKLSHEIKSATPQDLIDSGFTSIETQVKTELLEKLKSIDPFYFEKVILILLKKMGYGEFIETAKSGDGGIDGIINEDKLGLSKIYIQAKRYGESKVREKEIRNFIGAMSGDTSKGVFVTTSDFDKGAIKKAHEAHHTIILIDGKKLVDLMHQNNVGVQVEMTYEMKEIDNDFFEGE